MSVKSKKGVANKKAAEIKPDHTRFLKEIGKISAERSIRETKALNLPITYVENGKIVREEANGRKSIIGEI